MTQSQWITRRSLLQGTGSLLATALLSACGRSAQETLRLELLADAIPPQILRGFEQHINQRRALQINAQPSLSKLFDLLVSWKPTGNATNESRSSLPMADLVTLGDFWLSTAVQQQLLQPFTPEQLQGWDALPQVWQQLGRRNTQGQLDEQGPIWAAPYRWGTAMMVYRREELDPLGWSPADWSDLWRPELKRHISLPDSPRMVIGLGLKRRQQSANTPDPTQVPGLENDLRSLHQQVKFYSSEAYLQPLLLGDTWMAVGWSTDILPLVKRDRRLAAIVPHSGTLLTADLWVRPAGAPALSNLGQQWLSYTGTLETAIEFALLGQTPSPILTARDRATLPPAIQESLILPPDDVLQRSEFLLPLDDTAVEVYRQLWTNLRLS